jgi:hypothetical protein
MSQGKSPHIADLRRNLPRRLPLAFVSLIVGPHLQGLQALQLKIMNPVVGSLLVRAVEKARRLPPLALFRSAATAALSR